MEPPGRTFGAPGLRAIEGCGGSDQAFEPFLLVILKMEKFPPRECFRDPGAVSTKEYMVARVDLDDLVEPTDFFIVQEKGR